MPKFGSRAVKTGNRSPPATVRRNLLPGIILVAWLFTALSCGSGDAGTLIDLNANPQSSPIPAIRVPSAETLVLAVAAVNSPVSTFGSYAKLAEYLGAGLGMNADFVGGKTYAEINSLVKSGEATLAIVCSGAYVYGHAEFDLEVLAAPVIAEKSVYFSYLIVHEDSPIRNWKDLEGHTFAFTDPLSNSGRLVPLYQISQIGESPSSLFGNYIFTYSHENSIRAVANRLVDAAAVDSLVYDYALAQSPNEASGTKVVWRSPPFGINPVVVNPNLPASLKQKLRTLLLEMHTSEQGRSILEELRFDRFVPVDGSAYDSIRQMVNAVGEWGME